MSKVQVKFNRNVKYGKELYTNGQSLAVSKEDYDSLFESGVIGEVDDLPEDVDFFTLTREELEKVKNDDLKAFLDKEGIGYETKAIKEDLINLVLGE